MSLVECIHKTGKQKNIRVRRAYFHKNMYVYSKQRKRTIEADDNDRLYCEPNSVTTWFVPFVASLNKLIMISV